MPTTCGPPEWLTGKLQDEGTRSVRSPPRRPPLLATPIATPLQGGRPDPKGPAFCFLNYLFQGQKSALGARSYICCQRRFTASLWAQTKVEVYDHRVTLRNPSKHALQRTGVETRHFMRFQVRRRNLGRGGRAFWVGQAEFARRSRLEEAWEWVCCERL